MDVLLKELEIKHHKIRSRTSEHNRKVERSNNIPMAVLGYLTPKEKRSELEVFGMINYAV